MNKSDAEIEKALECCNQENGCYECPYEFACYNDKYKSILSKDALDYINRLKAKEKEQQEEIEILNHNLKCEKIHKESVIERYKNVKENLKAVLDERADHSEAIKEFAHLVIDKIDSGLITHSADIPDCVVEFLEMTENEGKE